jgi:hypothetical protein
MTNIREAAAKARAAWAQWSFYDIDPDADRDCSGGIIPSVAFEKGFMQGHAAGVADGARAFAEELERGGYRLVIHMPSTVPGSEVQEVTTEISASDYLCLRGSRPAPGTGPAKENDMKGDNDGKVS